jgi:hypothetical protein
MVDFLQSVDSDRGKLEPTPVTIVSGGAEVSLAALSGPNASTTPLGYQQLNSADLASSATLTVPTNAKRALIQNNGAQASRWRIDGPAPTALVGMRLAGGEEIDITGPITALRFIREAEGVQLDITYYG